MSIFDSDTTLTAGARQVDLVEAVTHLSSRPASGGPTTHSLPHEDTASMYYRMVMLLS